MTFIFLLIIIGCTSKGAAVGFAGINTWVNPARSTRPALFAGGEYLSQLWLAGADHWRGDCRVGVALVARGGHDRVAREAGGTPRGSAPRPGILSRRRRFSVRATRKQHPSVWNA